MYILRNDNAGGHKIANVLLILKACDAIFFNDGRTLYNSFLEVFLRVL
jgi:hypothetical protein